MKNIFTIIISLVAFVSKGQEIPLFVINEINCDNPGGPDTQEFIELYGPANASLDSLVLVFFDGTAGQSYAAFDLDGYSFDENGFFVIGNTNVVNVDLVIGNATLQNGQDALAIYHADEVNFPNGSLPTSVELIEAAVYGTGDANAANLITGLGLDIIIPGYAQLDETVQQAGADLSLSRLPDGGNAFENSTFVLQEITPGSWNQPLCFAGSTLNEDALSEITICDDLDTYVEHFVQDNTAYGDSLSFVVSNSNGEIIEVLASDSFEVSGLAPGQYFIHGFSFNGTLLAETTIAGLPYNQMLASGCISFSTDPVIVNVISCAGCIGGEISDSQFNSSISVCAESDVLINMISSSTSQDASYMYILTNDLNIVVDTFLTSYSANELAAGTYLVHGLSYVGFIEPTLLQPGTDASLILAETCSEFSTNTFTVNALSCNNFESCSTVFISEYLEGNNGTKAIELFNPTLSSLDLTGYSLAVYSNGSATPSATLLLDGTMDALGTFIIANPGTGNGNGQADPSVVALADVLDVVANFSGNDAIELRLNDVVIDVIGVVGEDPGNQSGWPVGEGNTRNFDLVRKYEIQSPMNFWELSSSQWDVYDNTDYSNLGNHLFQTCSSEILAGFIQSAFSANESDGEISIDIQGINMSSPIVLTVTATSGIADNNDFTMSGPTSFTFNSPNSIQELTISIVDDLELENDETFVLSLSSADNVLWLNQTITVTILANDPNCDGGTIALTSGQGPIDQCADLPNPAIDMTYNTSMPLANYAYVLTNSTNNIVEVLYDVPLNLDANGVGTYRIWGLSYTGAFDENSLVAGSSVFEIVSDSCASISSNFITVFRTACTVTGCDAGDVALTDNTQNISVCMGQEMNLSLINSGESVDDQYDYVLTDAADTIISISDGIFETSILPIGNYFIYGVSHIGNLDPATTVIGSPVSGILSNGCLEFTNNAIEVLVHDCTITPSCTYLFFSEYLEDSQSNKAIELYNPTNGDIDLSDYSIRMYSNGSTQPTFVLEPEGILSSHDVYLIVSSGNGQSETDPAILAYSDTLHPVATFSGNDALELVWQETVVDVIGVIGEDPGNQGWTFGNTAVANHDLVRRPEVISPNSNWPVVTGQWLSYEPTDYTHLGSHDAVDCESSLISSAGFVNVSTTVLENSGLIQVDVQAFNIVNPATIEINTTGGTAQIGLDYSAIWPVILQFPAGNSTQSFQIAILLDGETEGDETIELSLSGSQIDEWTNTESTITIANVLGIVEPTSESFVLYPNPADHSLNIRTLAKTELWRVLDMNGKVLKEGQTFGKNNFSIQVDDLPSGTYVLESSQENKVDHRRFVVLHSTR